MATKGWYKAECQPCNAETWHIGSRCVKHTDPKEKCKTHGVPVLYCDICNMPGRRTAVTHVTSTPRSYGRRKPSEQRTDTVIEDEWAYDLFKDDPDTLVQDASKHYCSFCGKETPLIRLTKETRSTVNTKLNVATDPVTSDPYTYESVSVSAEKVQACPSCSLQIHNPVEAYRV